MRCFSQIVVLSVLLGFCQSLNILVLWQHVVKSHFFVFEPLFKSLASKGHNLTVISYFPQKNPIPNYRDVSLLNKDGNLSGLGLMAIDKLKSPRLEMYTGVYLVKNFADLTCKPFLTHPNVVEFLNEKNQFDLILTEVFNTNCHNGVVKKFKNIPVIGKIESYSALFHNQN